MSNTTPTKNVPDAVDEQIRSANSLPHQVTDEIFAFVRGLTEPMPDEEFFALRAFWKQSFDFFEAHHDGLPEAQSVFQFFALCLSATNHRAREIAPLPDSPYPTVGELKAENEALKARVAELEAQAEAHEFEATCRVERAGENAKKDFEKYLSTQNPNALRNIYSLSFADYQRQARDTAVYKRTIFEGLSLVDDGGDLARLLKLSYTVLGLAGEIGEFANIVKKIERDGKSINEMLGMLVDELGDVFWYVFACADEIGVPAEDVARANIEKLAKRKQTNTIHDNGNRKP